MIDRLFTFLWFYFSKLPRMWSVASQLTELFRSLIEIISYCFGLSLHFVLSLQSAVCNLYPVCILYLVCSLQSAVCSLRFVLTETYVCLSWAYIFWDTILEHLKKDVWRVFIKAEIRKRKQYEFWTQCKDSVERALFNPRTSKITPKHNTGSPKTRNSESGIRKENPESNKEALIVIQSGPNVILAFKIELSQVQS